MTAPLRLGIAGLGTVGTGVVKIIQSHAAMLSARAGRPIEVTCVSARSRTKDRGVQLSAYGWEDDPVALASAPTAVARLPEVLAWKPTTVLPAPAALASVPTTVA